MPRRRGVTFIASRRAISRYAPRVRIATTTSCCWLAVAAFAVANFLAVQAQRSPSVTHCTGMAIDPEPACDPWAQRCSAIAIETALTLDRADEQRVAAIIDHADRILDNVERDPALAARLLRAGDLGGGLHPAADFVTR